MRYVEEIKAKILDTSDAIAHLTENMRRLAVAADEERDVPDGLFDGLDVRALNRAYLPPGLGGEAIFQDSVTRCVLSELLGYADAALTVALPGPSLSLPPLLELGTPEQQRTLLGRFDTTEPTWGAFAITEPSGGSDAMRVETRATRDGAGYRLAGEKCFIGNAGRASFVVAFATTDARIGQFGIHPLVVDRDTPGMTIDDSWPMLGMRAVRVSHLLFEDCWVPEERFLGRADGRVGARAFVSAQRSWEYMRPALSSMMVGALERLLDDLEQLADDVDDPSLRRTAAALAARARPEARSVRLLSHHAAALFDSGRESAVISSMAKAAASKLARGAAADAVAAIAAAGVAAHPIARDVERWARDFQAFELLEGTTEMHQLMITRGWSVRSRRQRKAADTAPASR